MADIPFPAGHSALCDKGHRCELATVQHPESGRWYVTFGHCGFNSSANNLQGYPTRLGAVGAIRKHQRPAFTAKIECTMPKGEEMVVVRNGRPQVVTRYDFEAGR